MGQSLVEEEQARASELSSMRQVLKMRVEGAKAESEAAQAQLQQVSRCSFVCTAPPTRHLCGSFSR